MNGTNISELSLLQSINYLKASSLLPVIIYISFLIVFGVMGNVMVCYFYIFRTKVTANTFFIVCLAVFDLISCCVLMPTEIVFDMKQFYTYTNRVACKVFVFGNYFTAISSCITLTAIAVDRYKHICRTSAKSRQISGRKAKVIGTVICILATSVTWPAFVLYDTIHIAVPNPHGRNLSGSDCTAKKDDHLSTYVTVFNMLHLAVFFICSFTVVILYAIILKSIFRHRKFLSNFETTCADDSVSNVSVISTPGLETYRKKDEEMVTYSNRSHSYSAADNCNEFVNTNVISGAKSLNNTSTTNLSSKSRLTKNNIQDGAHHKYSHDKNSSGISTTIQQDGQRKGTTGRVKTRSIGDMVRDVNNTSVTITIMMTAVSVTYIVSFLPSLCLIIWRTFTGSHVDALLTSSELVAYEIGLRSYFVNSSVNPWIYGVFNKKFRQFYFNMVTCRRKEAL